MCGAIEECAVISGCVDSMQRTQVGNNDDFVMKPFLSGERLRLWQLWLCDVVQRPPLPPSTAHIIIALDQAM